MSPAAHPYLRMAQNNAWANATLYRTLRDLDGDRFAATRPGFFPSLSATMQHILERDLYYLGVLDGSRVETVQTGSAAALWAAQADADGRLIGFCEGLTPEVLAGTRITPRASGGVEERVDALLLHLFQHQVHHRGQAHVQLSHAGVAPPQLDDFHLVHGRAPDAEACFR